MNHSKIAQSILIVLALALVGCANPAQRVENLGSENGSLTLLIPEFMPGGTLSLQLAPESRIYSTSYRIEAKVLGSSGESVADGTFFSTGSHTLPTIAPGTGYRIDLKVFDQSGVTMPVLVGSASGITVTSGQSTSVAITCVPYAPVDMVATQTVTLPGYGSQIYYKMNLEAGKISQVSLDSVNMEGSNNSTLGVFDAQGTPIVPWSTNTLVRWVPTYTGIAYVGVANRRLASHTIEVNAETWSPEEQNSSIDPEEITSDYSGYFYVGKSTPYFMEVTAYETGDYQLDLDSGEEYTLTVTPSEEGSSPTTYTSSSRRVSLSLTALETYTLAFQTSGTNPYLTTGTLARLLTTTGGSFVTYTNSVDYPNRLFVFNGEPSESFTVEWVDNYAHPTGTSYAADIKVTAFKQSRNLLNYYFMAEDSGYPSSWAEVITIPSGENRVYLFIEPFDDSKIGNFGIKVTKN